MGVVLITGCGSGFGRLAALEAARRGHIVYAGLRSMSSASDLRAAATGLDVIPLPLDVTVAEQRTAAVERILTEQGGLDGLVNNAGVALGGFLEDVDEDEIRHLFEVNVFGAWALTKACLPALRQADRATVVMISSLSAVMALPGLGAYAASKFA
ncbi:MAG: SDR family NAD(P)-dependent oxidoreductase, partial [Myxococcales bacterium]|nr:SDR family NAD(P)-dependent oxidoreductase [Myxococcales bacterium]